MARRRKEMVALEKRKGNHVGFGIPRRRSFCEDESGDAIVEATILFPVMIMIFAALVLLAIYLPTRGALQRATQYAATAIAATGSDTWLYFDKNSMSFYWETNKANLENVYAALFSGMGDVQAKGEYIVAEIEGRCLSSKAGILNVDCYVIDHIVYKEVVVTADREFTIPLDLSLIRFPQAITVTATSTAAVLNADEFIRNVDIAADFVEYANEKLGLTDISAAIGEFGSRVKTLIGM